MKVTVLVAAISVAMASTAAATAYPAAATGGARIARSCAHYSVPARIARKAVCLRDGQRCRTRLEQQYERYGFHCRSGSLAATWQRLTRRLHIPSLAPGATCPTSALASGVDFRAYNVGEGVGPGPVYPAPFSPDAPQPFNDFVVPPGWHGGKHAFFTLPGYQGPALIRGRQLDGPGVVSFASNEIPGAPTLTNPQPELRLPAGGRTVAHTFFFLTPPGCYAYQIDGTTFSTIVVFEIRLSSSP